MEKKIFDLFSFFEEKTLQEGFSFYQQKLVLNYELTKSRIRANLKITDKLFKVVIALKQKNKQLHQINTRCSCTQKFCSHAAAAFLQFLHDRSCDELMEVPSMSEDLSYWTSWFYHAISSFNSIEKYRAIRSSLKELYPNQKLIYILKLNLKDREWFLRVEFKLANVSSPIRWSQLKPLTLNYLQRLPTEDKDRALVAMNTYYATNFQSSFLLESGIHLQKMIQTGRAYLDKKTLIPLIWNDEVKEVVYDWMVEENAEQVLSHSSSDLFLLPCDPLVYLDHKTRMCGVVKANLPTRLIPHLLQIPSILPETIAPITQIVKKQKYLPLPKKISFKKEETLTLKPYLILSGVVNGKCISWLPNDYLLPMGELLFCYGQHQVDLLNRQNRIHYQRDGSYYYFLRNRKKEQLFKQQLSELPVAFFSAALAFKSHRNTPLGIYDQDLFHLIGTEIDIKKTTLESWQASLAQLKQWGWKIKIELSFPFR